MCIYIYIYAHSIWYIILSCHHKWSSGIQLIIVISGHLVITDGSQEFLALRIALCSPAQPRET